MASLSDKIQDAIRAKKFLISIHADNRCEERGISSWQVVLASESPIAVAERPSSEPHPTVVIRLLLADGSEAQAIWAWLEISGRAKLVTVFFPR